MKWTETTLKWLKANARAVTTRRSMEARALSCMIIVFCLSFVTGLVAFQGTALIPIFGPASIASVTLLLTGIAVFVNYLLVSLQVRQNELTNVSPRAKLRVIVTTVALGFVHASIAFLLATVLFYILDAAFTGLLFDIYASSILVATVTSLAAYGAYLLASDLSTIRISTVLAVFLVSGALTSMITASDPYWWQVHLSYLGEGYTFSSYAFGVTLVIGGLVLVSVADFVANDIEKLASRDLATNRVRTIAVRTILILIGIFLALVGLFRWDEYPLIHNGAAGGMVILFITLISGLPKYLPILPKAFFGFSFAMLGAILFCAYLYRGVGYLNLTAVEIVSFIIVFGWLVVFIRQIAAELSDQPRSKLQNKRAIIRTNNGEKEA